MSATGLVTRKPVPLIGASYGSVGMTLSGRFIGAGAGFWRMLCFKEA